MPFAQLKLIYRHFREPLKIHFKIKFHASGIKPNNDYNSHDKLISKKTNREEERIDSEPKNPLINKWKRFVAHRYVPVGNSIWFWPVSLIGLALVRCR